jgi:hypothetical protein
MGVYYAKKRAGFFGKRVKTTPGSPDRKHHLEDQDLVRPNGTARSSGK